MTRHANVIDQARTDIGITPQRRTVWAKSLHSVALLLGFLTTIPLVVVGLAAIAHLPFGVKPVLLFFMTVVASWAIVTSASLRDVNFSMDELLEFKREFAHLRFTRVPVSDYLEALKARVPSLQAKRDDEILPTMTRWQAGRLRVLVPTRETAKLGPLQQLVTYANAAGVWIVLTEPPDRLRGLGYFTLLHEIGHSALTSFLSRIGFNTGVRYMALPVLFVVLAIRPTWTQAFGLLALTGAWYAVAAADRRFLRAHARVYDEIAADRFALERCDPSWFKLPTFIERFVALETSDDPSECLSEADVRHRSNAFVENLARVQRGEPLQTLRELLPDSQWATLGDVLLIALLIGCGLAIAPLSLGRLFMLGAITLLAVVFALASVVACKLMVDVADDCFGVKQMAPERVDILRRATAVRQKMTSAFVGRH